MKLRLTVDGDIFDTLYSLMILSHEQRKNIFTYEVLLYLGELCRDHRYGSGIWNRVLQHHPQCSNFRWWIPCRERISRDRTMFRPILQSCANTPCRMRSPRSKIRWRYSRMWSQSNAEGYKSKKIRQKTITGRRTRSMNYLLAFILHPLPKDDEPRHTRNKEKITDPKESSTKKKIIYHFESKKTSS